VTLVAFKGHGFYVTNPFWVSADVPFFESVPHICFHQMGKRRFKATAVLPSGEIFEVPVRNWRYVIKTNKTLRLLIVLRYETTAKIPSIPELQKLFYRTSHEECPLRPADVENTGSKSHFSQHLAVSSSSVGLSESFDGMRRSE
jgi:hypothetical protein